jgi:head-tail adaptor
MLLFPISMHFYAVDMEQAEAEARAEIMHQRFIEMRMELERLDRAMEEARTQAIRAQMEAMESERRLLEVLAAEPSHD